MTLALEQASLAADGRTLLAPVSARFGPGRVSAVLGPNGAGKSSLLSLASGLRRPSTGQVMLDGVPLAAARPLDLARRRALMPQDTAVAFDYTAREIAGLGRHPHHLRPSAREAAIVGDALAAADVAHLADRIYNTLSGGEKARVQLARALSQIWEPVPGDAPRWLLLDEPTAALDLAHQHRVMRCVHDWARQHGVGVLAVVHDLNLALRYADDVLVLDQGRARVFGAAREVLSCGLVSQVWRVRCHAHWAPDGTPQYLFEGDGTSHTPTGAGGPATVQ